MAEHGAIARAGVDGLRKVIGHALVIVRRDRSSKPKSRIVKKKTARTRVRADSDTPERPLSTLMAGGDSLLAFLAGRYGGNGLEDAAGDLIGVALGVRTAVFQIA